MPPFSFQCPETARKVQADAPYGLIEHGETYLPIECPACFETHFVNPGTGKILGGRRGERNKKKFI
jgi:hypothetical protein